MGYFLTTSSENAVPGKSCASPKTHTPGSRVEERGHRYYSPGLGRWLSRDPMGEDGGVHLYGYIGNEPVGQFDALGLSNAPGVYGWPSFPVSIIGDENVRIAELAGALASMCPSANEVIALSPVDYKPQCCSPESCKAQALAFATRIVRHATLVRQAEYAKYGNIRAGWSGNLRRNIGGQPGLGGDGYLCWEWADQVEFAFAGELGSYRNRHELCFRGAKVSKGGGFSSLWNWFHMWFLVYGPRNTQLSYVAGSETVVVDPWPSAGLEMVPSNPYVAQRFEPGAQPFWSPGIP